MYGEQDKEEKAKAHKHMTFREAALLAKEAQVKELWLTHYSPSLYARRRLSPKPRKYFPIRLQPGTGSPVNCSLRKNHKASRHCGEFCEKGECKMEKKNEDVLILAIEAPVTRLPPLW